ncbi:MAG TPA: phytanoyl-CoA dioxygenase family protein [Polyangiales bacterium]|nr:phytanoyl-CoA dioxygenase family protein [Polyangiales bacterium]
MSFGPEYRCGTWDRDGFFVVPSLIDPPRISALGEACDHVLSQVRAKSQSTGHSTTHIAGLFAPEYFTDRPDLLARLIGLASSREVLGLIQDLGSPHDGALQFRTAHYFHEPSSRDYDGAWHRDGDEGQLPAVIPAAPRSTSLRVRLPFAHDDHLEIVAGSHRRDDTAEELQLRRGRIRNAKNAPGAVRIALAPGDVCVFDTWTIHRGRYRQAAARRTLDLVFGFGTPKTNYFDLIRSLRAL